MSFWRREPSFMENWEFNSERLIRQAYKDLTWPEFQEDTEWRFEFDRVRVLVYLRMISKSLRCGYSVVFMPEILAGDDIAREIHLKSRVNQTITAFGIEADRQKTTHLLGYDPIWEFKEIKTIPGKVLP